MTGGFTVLVAPSARKQASRVSDCWVSNREKAPDLFAEHVFFEVDEAKRQVHVLAIWHTARVRGPRL